MNDGQRLLRYAIPGTLFETAILGWLFIRWAELGWEPALPGDGPMAAVIAAIIAAATVPFGFVFAVLYSEIAWCERGWSNHQPRGRSQPFSWIDDVALMERFDLGLTDENRAMAAAEVDAIVHVLAGERFSVALDRGRQLLDQVNGLGASATAVGAAALLLGPLAWLGGDLDANGAPVWLAGYMTWLGLLAIVLARAQRRVARIATAYEAVLIRESLATRTPTQQGAGGE